MWSLKFIHRIKQFLQTSDCKVIHCFCKVSLKSLFSCLFLLLFLPNNEQKLTSVLSPFWAIWSQTPILFFSFTKHLLNVSYASGQSWALPLCPQFLVTGEKDGTCRKSSVIFENKTFIPAAAGPWVQTKGLWVERIRNSPCKTRSGDTGTWSSSWPQAWLRCSQEQLVVKVGGPEGVLTAVCHTAYILSCSF